MAAAKRTEEEMLALLRRRYASASGNGVEYAFVEHVRNDAGFSASRTIDAMAMSLWPSRGLTLYAFEVKCSRKDWLKELRDPAKAEAFGPYVDYFYLVVSDAGIVKPGELPDAWGLMAPRAGGIGVVREAPRNEAVRKMDRGMLAALLRQAGVEARRPPSEVTDAHRAGVEEGRKLAFAESAGDLERVMARKQKLEETQRRLRAEMGGDLSDAMSWDPETFWAAVRTTLRGERDVEHLRSRLRRLGLDARVIGEQADRILSEHFPKEEST